MRFLAIVLMIVFGAACAAMASPPPQQTPDDPAAEMAQEREGLGPFAQLQALLQSPVAQKLGRLATNPEFTAAADRFIRHPDRNKLIYINLGLLLVMLVFRAWRHSKVKHWARRLWVSFYTGVVFWSLIFVAVPRIVIGESYFTLWRVVFQTFRS